MDSHVSRKARRTQQWSRVVATLGLLVAAYVSLPAAAQRSVPEDFSTQMPGSDHMASAGPDVFGDSTDLYTGATQFLVTDVSLPGNSDLPVAFQRSLEAYDTGLGVGMPSSYMKWSR